MSRDDFMLPKDFERRMLEDVEGKLQMGTFTSREPAAKPPATAELLEKIREAGRVVEDPRQVAKRRALFGIDFGGPRGDLTAFTVVESALVPEQEAVTVRREWIEWDPVQRRRVIHHDRRRDGSWYETTPATRTVYIMPGERAVVMHPEDASKVTMWFNEAPKDWKYTP